MDQYFVIGSPIVQSKSPQMHNAAFQELAIDAVFSAVEVRPRDLVDWVAMFRKEYGKGLCVTIPHKTAIIPLLDEVSEEAMAIGAVNVVVNRDGKLVGYNTDGDGFVSGLFSLGSAQIKAESNVLLIGAGGAAKGIYYALASAGFTRITITNRTIKKAEQLSRHVVTLEKAETELVQYDIIVNTTSIGMGEQAGEVPLDLSNIKEGAVVTDIIYNPLQTKFLQEAKKRGAITQNGIPMFVGQGVLAFEHWTGIAPDSVLMEQVVLDQLDALK